MDHPVTVVYDANVLYPAPLRDLLIRLAQAGLVRARWTEAIHDEWVRNILKNNPALSPDRLGRAKKQRLQFSCRMGFSPSRLVGRRAKAHPTTV